MTTKPEKINSNPTIHPNKYFPGRLLGATAGFFIGIVISKLLLMDILPLYIPEFSDVREVLLIVYSQIAAAFVVKKKQGILSRLVPGFMKNFFSNVIGKIKSKLFFMFKVDPIPMHIKVMGVAIPLLVIILSMKIGAMIGGTLHRALSGPKAV